MHDTHLLGIHLLSRGPIIIISICMYIYVVIKVISTVLHTCCAVFFLDLDSLRKAFGLGILLLLPLFVFYYCWFVLYEVGLL